MNNYVDFRVADKVIAVTGGCGGIGMGLAKGLLEQGAKVIILDLNAEKLEQVKKDLHEQTGIEPYAYAVNICDEESIDAALGEVFEKTGHIDGLVNCAGISCVKPLAEMPIDRWAAVMDINVKGTVICSKIAGKYMAKNSWGRIVNISSLAATHGKPGYTAYTPSKAAINGFTFTLATEWARLGITVNSISPVMVVTDINRAQIEADPSYLERALGTIPQGRLCSPELLLGPLTFLLSEASSYVTGQNLGVDGGCQNGDIAVIKPVESM